MHLFIYLREDYRDEYFFIRNDRRISRNKKNTLNILYVATRERIIS